MLLVLGRLCGGLEWLFDVFLVLLAVMLLLVGTVGMFLELNVLVFLFLGCMD